MIRLNNNIESNNLPILFFPSLSKYQNLVHFVTTRKGGFSLPPFNSLNLAFHVGDEREKVLKNRKRLARYLHIPLNYFTVSNQVHGVNIAIVGQAERGSGATDISTSLKDYDAMITDQNNVCLIVFVADCVPVMLYDKRKKIIAVIHAGWKGTVSKISQKTFYLMESRFACKASDIICAIGPSIGPCCYQVGPEVLTLVRKNFPAEKGLIHSVTEDGKGYFDLWEANRVQLLDCHIPEQNIEVAGLCTSCHPDLFFSSRKGNGNTGRFAAGIMMKK
jgi:polyphenol oxidase